MEASSEVFSDIVILWKMQKFTRLASLQPKLLAQVHGSRG